MPKPQQMNYPDGGSPVVCEQAAASRFNDDAKGTCMSCGCAIAYRPYMPDEAPKICVDCYKRLRASAN